MSGRIVVVVVFVVIGIVRDTRDATINNVEVQVTDSLSAKQTAATALMM